MINKQDIKNLIITKQQELNNLQEQYNQEVEKEKTAVLKTKGFDKVLYLLSFEFESSTTHTAQYLEFYKIFKKEFKVVLKPYCKEILINKNHFYISGFFRLNDNRVYYFSIGDLRLNKDNLLIRTAKDFKDYSGGSNNYISLNENFINNLIKYLNPIR